MAEILPLSNHPTRCRECRTSSDCPMMDDAGEPTGGVIRTRVRVLHHGDRLYRTGDSIDAVYRVRSGVVKTSLTGNDGAEQVTGFFGAGEWVGLDGLDDARHRSEASALDTVSVCVIPYNILRDGLNTSSRTGRIMLSVMSKRIVTKENMHLSLARESAGQRLAAFLLDLSERRASVGLDRNDLALPMSRGEIASYLALAVETVSRLLTRMHRSDVIVVHRSQVQIVDLAALENLAGRLPAEPLESRSAANG